MKFLLDENLSPRLAAKLQDRGHFAEHVAHCGLSSESDAALWVHAFGRGEIVLTINARDFLHLARATELHAGLVVLRSQGLTADEQWLWLQAAIAYLEGQSEDYLINRVLEIRAPGPACFEDRPLPP